MSNQEGKMVLTTSQFPRCLIFNEAPVTNPEKFRTHSQHTKYQLIVVTFVFINFDFRSVSQVCGIGLLQWIFQKTRAAHGKNFFKTRLHKQLSFWGEG